MPTANLERAQRFRIAASVTRRAYDISLARPLPLRATGRMPETCPILITLDSSLTFGTIIERLSLSAALGTLQPAVVVGIGYPGDLFAALLARTYDFTPVTPPNAVPPIGPLIGTEFGGADAFLDFLVDELAPAVRERAPEAAAGRLLLHGFSLGGLFAAHALLRRPAAFEGISMIAPSLWWNDFAVLRLRQDFVGELQRTKAAPRVLVGAGELEQVEPQIAPPGVDLEELRATVRRARMLDAARAFAADLAGLLPSTVEFVCFEGEDHSGALTAGTGRAVRFLLPRSGVEPG